MFANSIADAEKSLAKSIKLLKTDYFDVLYYHGLGNLDITRAWEADGVFTWLLKQKKAGKCRFVGVSGHNLAARFPRFLESGEVDVVLAIVNFADRHTYHFEEEVLPVARKHNVGIVAMKVFGGAAGMEYKNLHAGGTRQPARAPGAAVCLEHPRCRLGRPGRPHGRADPPATCR